MKTTLQHLAAKLTALHSRFASSEQARNWKNFAALAVILAVIASMAQVGQSPETSATLKVPTQFPITMDGKQVGTSTLPVGTKVTVMREDAATGKTLVRATMGEVWVAATEITMQEPPMVEKSANVVPQAAPQTPKIKEVAVANDRKNSEEYANAMKELKANADKQQMLWCHPTPNGRTNMDLEREITDQIGWMALHNGWDVRYTPLTETTMTPDGLKKQLPDGTIAELHQFGPKANKPENNEDYYEKAGAKTKTDIVFDAIVWTDNISLPTKARLLKEIQNGTVVFLQKECGDTLRKYPEFRDLVPSPNPKSFSFGKKKNVVVYTINGNDLGSKTLEDFFHLDLDNLRDPTVPLKEKNKKVRDFCEQFLRYAQGK